MSTKGPTDGIDFTATLVTARPHEVLCRRGDGLVLHVLEGADAGAQFEVKADRIVVGRNALCDVMLHDPSVSQRHLALTFDAGGVLLHDLGSRNGTWMGLGRIETARLHAGAEFLAGNCKLQLAKIGTADIAVYREDRFGCVLGVSEAMRALFSKLERLAPTPLDVLLLGDTGTGKERVAEAIHEASGRRGPMVVVDCTRLTRELAEGLLLGHARGAFTGAMADRAGPFEDAAGGTVFLDEVGELPLDLQPKLLRIIDSREVTRVGENRARPVDVRIIAATNRDLAGAVVDGSFRLDLYQRLRQAEVYLPPLDDRREDIPLYANEFLRRVAEVTGRSLSFSRDAMDLLMQLSWTGNVRELKLGVERTAYMTEGDVITRQEWLRWDNGLPVAAALAAARDKMFEMPIKDASDAFQRDYLERLMREVNGDTRAAAERSGYTLRGLQAALKRHGIRANAED